MNTYDNLSREELINHLQQLQHAFDSIIEDSALATCTVDLDDNYRFLQVNPIFTDRSQYTKQDYIGKTPMELDYEIDPEIYRTFERVKDPAISHLVTSITYKRKDGTETQTILSVQQVQDATQNIAVCLLIDLNDIDKFQNDLKVKDAMLQNIMDSMEDTYVETDENFCITFANKAVLRIYDVESVQYFIGNSILPQFVNPEDADKLIADLHATQKIDSKRLAFTRLTGEQGWMTVRGNGVFEDGILKGTRVIIRDVSAEVAQEEKLNENNEKLQGILASLTDAYVQSDENGLITYCNPTFYEIFGYSPEETIGKHISMTYGNPEERERLLKNNTEGDDIHDFTTLGRRKDGSTFWLSVNGKCLRDKFGKIIQRQVLVRDITERVEEEIKLQESNQKLNSILSNLSDAYCSADAQGRITYVNQEGLRQTQYTEKELLGESILKLYASDSERKRLYDSFDEDGKVSDFITQAVRKDGSHYWVSINGQQHFDDNGEFLGCQMLIRDVSERMKREEELRQSNEQLNAILNNLSDAYVQTDKEGLITYVNPTFISLFGYESSAEVVGRHVGIVYGDLEERERLLEEKRNYEDISDYTTTGRKKDGTIFWISVNGRFIKDQNGLVVQREVLVRDISERMRLEQKEKEDHIFLNDIFESFNDGFFQTNSEGEIDFTNDKLAKMLGYGHKDELLGLPIINFYFDKNMRKRILASASNNKYIDDSILQIQRKNGSVFWGSLSGRVLKDNNGSTIYTRASVRDITERMEQSKAVENAKMELEKSQLRFQSLSEQSSEGIVLMDENGKYEYFNRAFCELHDMTEEEMWLSQEVREINPVGEASSQIDLVLRSKQAQHFNRMPFLQKDGSLKYANIHGSYLQFPHETLLLFTFTDITSEVQKQVELMEAKEDLQMSQLRFQGLSEQSSEGIVLYDENGYVVFFNNAFCKLLNLDASEVEGKHISDFNKEIGKPKEHFKDILSSDGTVLVEKEPFLQKDGSLKYAHVNGSMLDLPHEKLILVTFHEITNEIRKQKELHEAKQKAVEAERVKSAFLMNMSHEIRTPMNGILGFVDLLSMDDLSDEDRQNYVDIINMSGQRLLGTINDIIEVSRIESGKLEVRQDPIDLIEFMEFGCKFFLPQAKAKGLDFECNINIKPKDSKIISDEKILDGICSNLVKNAIKFTEKGTITFSCSIEEPYIKIEVSDSGQGISEERQNQIFEQFSQADKEYLNRKHQGSGLGLTITKAYVESLNGKISLSSKVNEGSTFTVILPYLKSK